RNTAPSVFPLSSCCTMTSSASQDKHLVCLVTSYSPSLVRIRWNSGGDTKWGQDFPETLASNGFYTRTSLLTIPAGDWIGKTYQCDVTHDMTSRTVSAEFPKADTISPVPGCHPLPCHAMPILNLDVHPSVFLLPPSLEELYVGQNATITCVVSGMESPSSLEISWSKGNGGLLTEDHREPVLHPNGTYSAASVLRVCVEEWQAGEEFTCTVKHQDIPSAEVKTIHKSLEVSLRAPSVYVSPPHAEELALQEWATITCLASGFRPKDILVTWTRKDRPLPQEAYTNISPMREAGEEESYFIYSKLRIQASEWQKGDTYSCMVAHEGLPKIFTQRSVDKASGVEDPGVCAEGGEGESDPLWTPVTFITLFLLSLMYSTGVTLFKVRASVACLVAL
uniref:Ig-like domain-containing protein n=1 Tax=Pelodiscus sinensis TaxID=13735 RepID=K7FHB8_PELSI